MIDVEDLKVIFADRIDTIKQTENMDKLMNIKTFINEFMIDKNISHTVSYMSGIKSVQLKIYSSVSGYNLNISFNENNFIINDYGVFLSLLLKVYDDDKTTNTPYSLYDFIKMSGGVIHSDDYKFEYNVDNLIKLKHIINILVIENKTLND